MSGDLSYTTRPTRLRVFMEEWADGAEWSIDGADNFGRYTEAIWSHFPTQQEALAAVPDFVETLEADWGVRFEWAPERPKYARFVNYNRGIDPMREGTE